MVHEMPHALASLESGEISEWRATMVVRETACLSREHRAQVDAELAARKGGFASMGDRQTAAEARRIGYRLDPHPVTKGARKAESGRRVTLRPAPDTMTLLTALLPARQGVAAYAALSKHAGFQRSDGDERTRGQVMADALVERPTGQATADSVPVEVSLVVSDRTLLGNGSEPANLEGYGPVPAPLVRDWIRGETAGSRVEAEAQIWLCRLYRRPADGALVAMDKTQRLFEGKLRRFLIHRDQQCRTRWCDAPIRHVDHPVPSPWAAARLPTTAKGFARRATTPKRLQGGRRDFETTARSRR